jgi:prevent-host-death family protein
MKVGLREANQQFSRAVRAVRAGKEVILTDRGHPIAVIKPIKSEDPETAALRAMADEGLITLPRRRGPLPPQQWRPPRVTGKTVSKTVIEEREDRA